LGYILHRLHHGDGCMHVLQRCCARTLFWCAVCRCAVVALLLRACLLCFRASLFPGGLSVCPYPQLAPFYRHPLHVSIDTPCISTTTPTLAVAHPRSLHPPSDAFAGRTTTRRHRDDTTRLPLTTPHLKRPLVVTNPLPLNQDQTPFP
jgi:hypothetical protein